jgi:hypothetical protein
VPADYHPCAAIVGARHGWVNRCCGSRLPAPRWLWRDGVVHRSGGPEPVAAVTGHGSSGARVMRSISPARRDRPPTGAVGVPASVVRPCSASGLGPALVRALHPHANCSGPVAVERRLLVRHRQIPLPSRAPRPLRRSRRCGSAVVVRCPESETSCPRSLGGGVGTDRTRKRVGATTDTDSSGGGPTR